MKNFLVGIVLLVAFSSVALAQNLEPAAGQIWTAGAYCTTEQAARLLSQAFATSGAEGFAKVMMRQGVPCFHSKMMANVATPQVKLVEKVWSVTTSDGLQLDFWTAASRSGTIGWIWFSAPAPNETQEPEVPGEEA